MPKYRRVGNQIVALLKEGLANNEICTKLGVDPSSVTHHAKKLGLSKGRYSRADWPEIIAAYNAGASYEDCCKKFNITLGSMWKAARSGKFIPRPQARPPLTAVEHSEKLMGKSHGRWFMRRKILSENLIPYLCAECGICEWRGRPLTLRLDHIDGDNTNHALSNYRFICPNCDSQSDTYCYRNAKRKRAIGEMENTLVLETSAEKLDGFESLIAHQ